MSDLPDQAGSPSFRTPGLRSPDWPRPHRETEPSGAADEPVLKSRPHIAPLTVREQVLRESLRLTTGERNEQYGPPARNLGLQQRLYDAYKRCSPKGYHSDAHEAAMQLIFAKIARIASGVRLHRDNYVDLAAYAAIAYECDVEEHSDTTCDGGGAEC